MSSNKLVKLLCLVGWFIWIEWLWQFVQKITGPGDNPREKKPKLKELSIFQQWPHFPYQHVILLYTVPFVDQLTSSFKYKINFLTCDLLLHTHCLTHIIILPYFKPRLLKTWKYYTPKLWDLSNVPVGSYFKEFLSNTITACILNTFLFTYSTQLLYKINVCDIHICTSLISFPFFLLLKSKQDLNCSQPHAIYIK